MTQLTFYKEQTLDYHLALAKSVARMDLYAPCQQPEIKIDLVKYSYFNLHMPTAEWSLQYSSKILSYEVKFSKCTMKTDASSEFTKYWINYGTIKSHPTTCSSKWRNDLREQNNNLT